MTHKTKLYNWQAYNGTHLELHCMQLVKLSMCTPWRHWEVDAHLHWSITSAWYGG